MTEPLAAIGFTTNPYVHNLFEGAAVPGKQCCFAGDWFLHAQMWGAYALNVTKSTGSFSMVSPVTDLGPNFQPPAFCECGGDFHQSAQFIVASPGAPKWVITTIPNMNAAGCTGGRIPAKVQLYRLDATGLHWYNQVHIDARGSDHRIIGDKAYIDYGTGKWAVIPNLNAPTYDAVDDVAVAPPFTPQPDIQGYTFKVVKLTSTNYRLDRIGGTVPLPELYKGHPEGIPNRQQMFATMWNIIKKLHELNPTLQIPITITQQQFCDVPQSNFAFEAFNSFKQAGIISAGNEPCDETPTVEPK